MMKNLLTGKSFSSFLRDYWILMLFVAAKFFLQYTLVNPVYELHRDEFLHLDQARHLSWGFISLPPLTSVFSRIIFLLGGDIFWIKFFPALFGAMTIIFAWLITATMGGKLFSKIVVSSAVLFSVFVRINMLFQPNSFDILAWTAIFFFLIRYFNTGEKKWLWYVAVAAALGFYNKYNVLFLFAGLFLGILPGKERKLLLSASFLRAIIFAFILVLPNLVWQIMHDFPFIDHMRVLKEYQLNNNTASGFIASQLKIVAGSLPLVLSAVFAFITFEPFRKSRFIGWSSLFIIILFSAFKAKDYYALGLYPVLFCAGAVFLEQIPSMRWRNAVLSFLLLLNIAVFAVLVRIVMPVMPPAGIIREHDLFERSGLLRWEDGRNHALPQDFADMAGWKEMAEKAYAAYKTIPSAEISRTLVFCDNYGQAGALNYYNRGRMKEAFSFNTDYIYWLPRIDTVKNVLLVGDMPGEEISKMFGSWAKTDSVQNGYARELGTGIFIFRDAIPSFTGFFYGEAERRKQELDIF